MFEINEIFSIFRTFGFISIRASFSFLSLALCLLNLISLEQSLHLEYARTHPFPGFLGIHFACHNFVLCAVMDQIVSRSFDNTWNECSATEGWMWPRVGWNYYRMTQTSSRHASTNLVITCYYSYSLSRSLPIPVCGQVCAFLPHCSNHQSE